MPLSYDDTKKIIDIVLASPKESARKDLNATLKDIGCQAGTFYASILYWTGKGKRQLPYTSDQWFDFLSKVPNRDLLIDPLLMSKLSETQRDRLPPAIFSSGSTNKP